jgi:hypothetical protein
MNNIKNDSQLNKEVNQPQILDNILHECNCEECSNKKNFINAFYQSYQERRFSLIPNPYANLGLYEDYGKCQKTIVDIEPGEMLFIPAGWFHYVISEQDKKTNLNMAISYFTHHNNCVDCDLDKNQNFKDLEEVSIKNLIYDKYKNFSQPFVIRDYFKHNKQFSLLNMPKDKIKKIYPQKVKVTESKKPLFASNFVKKHFPGCCEEKEMLFDEFLNSNNKSCYLIQSEHNIKEIPYFLEKEKFQSINSWINFGDCYTALHYDCFNNILMQIYGKKKVILIPPSEYKSLHLINTMDTKLLCKIKTILNL